MAKLDGVKTLDMVNGEITKVEYNGEVYEKVDTPKKGDIGLRISNDRPWASVGEFYPITHNGVSEAYKDDVGDEPLIKDGTFTYFRKPSAPSLKAGDKVRPRELFAKVNRPNNVPIPGDYVEFRDDIAEECSSFLTIGKKYEVERVDAFGGADITDDNGDYESAEPYETKAIYVKYTQEQAVKEVEVGDKILVVDAKTTGGNYGNGDILTVSTGYSEGVFVEEFARGLWNEEFIVLNPEQVVEATEGEPEAVEEPEVEESKAEGVPFEVGQFVVAKDNSIGYVLTIPEVGALDVVEVGKLVLGGDIRVKFNREFKGKYGKVAEVGESYPVNSDHFRLATDEEIIEALGLNEIKEGDKVEVLADNHPLLRKGATFTVTDVYDNGVRVGTSFVAFVSNGKPRIKIIEKGEKQLEIKSKDLPVGTKVRGKRSGVTYTLYGRSPEYDGNYGKAYYTEEGGTGWIGAEQFEVISKPRGIEEGDLVRVIDSPGALPDGSVFKVTKVDEDGTLYGTTEYETSTTQYIYEPKRVELVAKEVDVYV